MKRVAVCDDCGSTSVEKHTTATWSVRFQRWTHDTDSAWYDTDSAWCTACAEITTIRMEAAATKLNEREEGTIVAVDDVIDDIQIARRQLLAALNRLTLSWGHP